MHGVQRVPVNQAQKPHTATVRESTIREPNRTPPRRGFEPLEDKASDRRVLPDMVLRYCLLPTENALPKKGPIP
jgi:hypothetical protein